ncbi:hypothetical protein C6503_01750 [Candidatus Poribacteria bacterium]|nr:MAG: hypothetical protein C6503_01750 [Candidatus Poribacteria bacterium]
MKEVKQEKGPSRSFTRRDFLSTSLKVGAATFTTGLLPKLRADAQNQYNVLFIMVDDLRPLLGCYGHSEMHTPNIDRIAEQGTLFNRAYCQYPLCSPSRTSMITGLRPETTNVLNNSADFREKLPDVVTLPQHFKEHGYHTQSVGRVFHLPTLQDDENSWSAPSWRPAWIPFNKQTTPSWQALDVGDDELRDGKTAKRAVQVLEQIKESQFFLTVGFYKPHLPLKVPRKYFDLYNTQIFNLPASSTPPKDAPVRALTNWGAIRDFQDLPSGTEPLSDGKTLELIRAYAAATSYVDAQIGRVLNQLDTLGLTERTVIVFCGDHGHHLGEHGIWGKQTLFEVSLRSPLIFSVPGQTHPKAKTNALAELVDIYPTLCGACQIPIPPQLEGTSLMPVIEQPTRRWKTATFSRFRGAGINGVSIRTERYRYTERGANARYGRELYDYDADPNETVNIANLPENAELVTHLSERLHAGWQAALPEMQARGLVPQTLPWDVNDDGLVDIQDLIMVSNNFDVVSPEPPKVDVNKDGRVDLIDLLLVAVHFGESDDSVAPSIRGLLVAQHTALIDEWLAEARLADDGSDVFRQGIAALERLIHTTLPTETTLLPNYPNPFNPETWIPYDLAKDVDVHIDIYNLKGESIRQLSLGFQTAGTYRTSSRAAYWDGRNAVGEPVASGIYFYTFQAGEFKATRQMVITK